MNIKITHDISYNFSKLYNEIVPNYLQEPIDLIREQLQDNNTQIFEAFSEDEKYIGFALTFTIKHLVYVLYFVIDPKFRDQGIGSAIAQYILQKYKDKNVVFYIQQSPHVNNVNSYEFFLNNQLIKTNYNLTGFMGTCPILSSKPLSDDDIALLNKEMFHNVLKIEKAENKN